MDAIDPLRPYVQKICLSKKEDTCSKRYKLNLRITHYGSFADLPLKELNDECVYLSGNFGN